MRNNLIVMVALMCLGISLATPVQANNNVNWGTQYKLMKSQQKLEWHALMVQQQNRKASWKSRQTTSAEHSLANHQMQRERRDMKQRQKDAIQDMKDREKSLKSVHRSY